jgi:hypothetical protein
MSSEDKKKKEMVITDAELKEVEDPVMATALILKELRRLNNQIETLDWKTWEIMKKVAPQPQPDKAAR